jgi:hypothetical protein
MSFGAMPTTPRGHAEFCSTIMAIQSSGHATQTFVFKHRYQQLAQT